MPSFPLEPDDPRYTAGVLKRAALTVLLWFTAAAAQTGNPETPLQAQLQRGGVVYVWTCTVCHGDRREGLTAPPLRGADFLATYAGQPQALHDFVRDLMPQDRPGSLSEQDVMDVVAYLLGADGLQLPASGLTPDNLNQPLSSKP